MPRPVVTIVYNTCVYVLKTRLPLIGALQDAGYDVVVVAPTDEATPRLTERGVVHRPIRMSQYGMNPIDEIRSIREIERVLRDLKPAVSLHYTIKPNTFGTIAAHRAGVPVFNNIAGAGRAFTSGNPLLRRMAIFLYRQALGKSHTVFFQNGDDMTTFRQAGLVRESQCVRIPGSGVDLTRFVATPLPTGPLRFLFVGRLLKEKGIVEFLRAAQSLLERSDPAMFRFDIVGEHEMDRSYISKDDLNTLTAPEQVTYHGAVAPERIDGFIRNASCVVLPSYYGEGVPRVLLEACASGRPIITTDNVGCRDVVESGVNGYKIAVRDVAALASAMKQFSDLASDERSALASAARKTAESRFDEKIVLHAYLIRIAQVGRATQALNKTGRAD